MGQNLKLETAHLQHVSLPQDGELSISRGQMIQLMLESHRKSISAAEEILCLKEIAKIQGLYESKKTTVNINIEQQVQKLEVLSDEELLRLTNQDATLFDKPEPMLVEYEEVEDAEYEEMNNATSD